MANTDPVLQQLQKARMRLLFQYAFIGSLAVRFKLIDATAGGWCRTLAIDGKNIYYNREFVKSLSPDETMFVIGHETFHCIFDHLGRTGMRDRELFNMANDYIVNYVLKKENIGAMPSIGLYNPKYNDEWTSEQVYEDLKKNNAAVQQTLDVHLDLENGKTDEDDDDDGDGSGDNGQQGKGKGKPKLGKGNAQVGGAGGDDEGSGPPKLSREEIQSIRNDMKAAVIEAAMTAAQKGAGNVPASILRLIKDLTEPVMNWKELLTNHITSQIKGDYTFNIPSRRSWGNGVILPSQRPLERIRVAVCIDMSGSISDQQGREMISEVVGIVNTFEDYEIILWTFDTQVYNPQVFTPENIDEIYSYDIKGGGGTDFEVNFDFMLDPYKHCPNFEYEEETIDVPRFVMFTDGYPCGGWGPEDQVDTLFVIHGNTSIVAPFGTTAYYDEAKK